MHGASFDDPEMTALRQKVQCATIDGFDISGNLELDITKAEKLIEKNRKEADKERLDAWKERMQDKK